MNLIGDDEIVSAVKVEEGKNILLLTELGKGKRTGFDSFSLHGRGTMGQRIYSLNEGDRLVGATSVSDDEDVILITKLGQVLRIPVSKISYQGKNASGVIIATFKKKNDRINAMDITIHEDVVEEDESMDVENDQEENTVNSEKVAEEAVIVEESVENTEE